MKQNEVRPIEKQLKAFGLGDTDAKIYLLSLQLGPSTVQELAKMNRLNRVTVHSAVERLIEKGFLFESRKGKRRLVVASDPKTLRRLAEAKKAEVERMTEGLEGVVELLEKFQSTDRYFPTVRFYEGTQGFHVMFEETYRAKSDVLVFSYVPIFEKAVGEENLKTYFEKRAKHGIHTKLLFPPSEIAERIHKQRNPYNVEVRLIPKEYSWNAALFVWNDSVALHSLKEGRLTSTIVENKDIANMMRTMHALIWERSQPMI
ncbi:MAG TPA: helix-turn-helix domain-containing protein [Patescibacteria group bacterium]|nr:helix-turn-helix domain-containing protein [Patescibacteria group bacterium]